MTYTVEDLDAAVLGDAFSLDMAWGGLSWTGKEVELPGIGTLRVIEYRDEEFETKCWIIVSVTDAEGNERRFRRNGWRQSHYGSELDGPTEEVHPVEKIITVWETK